MAPENKSTAEEELIEAMAGFSRDPLGWVYYSFEWGEGELADHDGPDKWQIRILTYIRDRLQAGLMTLAEAVDYVIKAAVASGHGVGKSALVAWVVLWAMSTMEDNRGVVTANTEKQLMTKTWPEISKWYRLFIAKHWFTLTATAIFSKQPEHEKTWRVDIIPWSEKNTEAFAGLHNQGKRILVVFDEASAIADAIWEVTEGAMTDANTEIIWLAFGNPTRNDGRFRECWRKFRARWHTVQVDSREAKMSNKKQIAEWIEDWGENHDFVKVRVKGEFPAASDKQFISSVVVDAARKRHLNPDDHSWAPVIITCDPAWWGGDETVIGMRQGRKFLILKTLPKNDDDVFVAGLIAGYEDQYKADAVIIDQGYGTGIYSVGKAMNRVWILVAFGSSSGRPDCVHKRDEIWYLTREWLNTEQPDIPDDPMLAEDLTGPQYNMTLSGQIKLESKEDMKARGVPSPNRGDALALSFAVTVVKKGEYENQRPITANTTYTMKTFRRG